MRMRNEAKCTQIWKKTLEEGVIIQGDGKRTRSEVIQDERERRKLRVDAASKTENGREGQRTRGRPRRNGAREREYISGDRASRRRVERGGDERGAVDKGKRRRIGTREIGANKGCARRREHDRRHRTRRRRKHGKERGKRQARQRERKSDCDCETHALFLFRTRTNALHRLNVLALTVSPLDIYAAADVDVTCTVIHGHLVRLTHRGRHHKTLSGFPLPPQRDDRTRPINRLAQLERAN